MGYDNLGIRPEMDPRIKARVKEDKEKYKEFDEAVRQGKLKEGVKIRQVLDNAWQGAKTVEDWRNPFDVGAAGAAHTMEFLLPQTKEELMLEMVTLGQGKKIKAGQKVLNKVLADVFDKRIVDPLKEKWRGVAYGLGGTGGAESMKSPRPADPSGWEKIPPEHRLTSSGVSETDKLAKVTKRRIREHVQDFGGNEEDVIRIWKEHQIKHKNIKDSRTWLNKYFKKLSEGLGPDGLKDAIITDIKGVPTLVSKSSGLPYSHAFEVDHKKAKIIFARLAKASGNPKLFAGADFHENLENVYTVFNRAKNKIGNPAIPDQVSRAIGQSTSLREFVHRRIDETFNKQFTHIPREFREAAKKRMLDNIANTIPIKGKKDKLLNRIVEEEKKLWKWLGPIIEEANTAPPVIQKQLSDFANSTNPVKEYENIKSLMDRMGLNPNLVKRYKKAADEWLFFMQQKARRGTNIPPVDSIWNLGQDN